MPYVATTATRKIMAMKKRIRAVQGGTSASKTVSNLLFLIHLAQTDKSPTLASVVSESFPHLKRGAIRDFLLIMQEQGYYKEDRWNKTDFTYTFETNSKIEFFSADQPDKVRGPRRHRLFLNEANNLSFETFEQLEIRTSEFVILDWNPTNEFWFYTDVKPVRKDVDHIILTYKDNEALEKAIVDSIEQRMNRKGWWQVYGLGQLGEVDGKIYKDWGIMDSIPPEAKLERYGLDFGYSNDPSGIVAIYSWNGAYIFDQITYQKGLSNKQIADIINNLEYALVVADSADPKSIDEIKSYGVQIVGAVKGRDSVRHGIQYVQQQKCFITRGSADIIREYRNYLWKTDRDGKIINEPEHQYSHSMDAIRYGMDSLKPEDVRMKLRRSESISRNRASKKNGFE